MTSVKRDIELEEVVRTMNMSAGSQERENHNAGRGGEALLSDSPVITLAVIATLSFSCLFHIDNKGTVVLASQCLEATKDFPEIQASGFLCNVVVNVSKSGLIHGGAVATFYRYDEPSNSITMKNKILE